MAVIKAVLIVVKLFLLRVLLSMIGFLLIQYGESRFPAPVFENVAVLFSGNFASKVDKSQEIRNDSLAAVYVTFETVTLKREDGITSSVLLWPVERDLLSTEGVTDLIGTATFFEGVYVGGMAVISSAKAEFKDKPGVLVPVSLPQGGEFPVDMRFEVLSDPHGTLKLNLDQIKILQLTDSSLALETELRIEAKIRDRKQNNNAGQSDLVVENVEADGVILHLRPLRRILGLMIADSPQKKAIQYNVKVNYGRARILLPPDVEGGEPREGTAADLSEDACVHVTGALTVGAGVMDLEADMVQIIAYNSL